MIRESESESTSGSRLPGVQRVPVIGNLFSSKSKTLRRTELLVFLTPKILRDVETANAYSLAVREDLARVCRVLDERRSGGF